MTRVHNTRHCQPNMNDPERSRVAALWIGRGWTDMKVQNAIRVAAASCLVLGACLIAAPPAQASYPDCTGPIVLQIIYGTDGDWTSMPAYQASNTNCQLGTWSASGYAVSTLQRALDACYNQGLAIDGSFGPLTKAALQRVQRAVGVTTDGAYGPQTEWAMKWPAYAPGGYYVRACVPRSEFV